MSERKLHSEPTQQSDESVKFHHESDKIFKIAMQNKETALEYVKNYFKEMQDCLDFDHFELDTTEYIKSDFDEMYSDVVYRTQLKEQSPQQQQNKKSKKKLVKRVAITLLFEHKSSIKSSITLFIQLLEYIILIWKKDISDKKPISIVIPIVVYQNKKKFGIKQLHLSRAFKDVPRELLKYIPNFECHLTDIHSIANKDILNLSENGLLRSLFLAYKYIENDKELEDKIIEIFTFFQILLEYLLKKGYLSPEKIDELFTEYLSDNQKENIKMTTFQEWTQKAKIEGKIEKARLTVLRGRRKGFSVADLADISELPYSEVENLIEGYEYVYASWLAKKTAENIPYLSKMEVEYLINLFEQPRVV